MTHTYDAIIFGAGPAGLTAGIYMARARLRPLIIDTATVGGQMVLSHKVANYPGVAETSGHEITQTMRSQAQEFGCDILPQSEIIGIDISGETKTVEVEDEGIFQAPVAIIAVGGRPRTLGAKSEERLKGLGISYCATCDGDFFTGKPIVVVGGGNSALEEASSLTKYASKVTVLHLLDEFQAQKWALDEAKANPKVELRTGHRVLHFDGEEKLRAVVTENTHTGEVVEVPAEGAFVVIGYEPNTEPFRGQIDMTQGGEIMADEAMRASVPGVYVAGDCRQKRYRQITTAVSDGTIAALEAIDYIEKGGEHRDHQAQAA